MDTLVPGTTWTVRASRRAQPSVPQLVRFGLWMGLVGFGGGLSVLASLRDGVVQRRGWLTEREFDDTATVAQMLPGGAAANALALLGLRSSGAGGALAAYAAFILPGFVATVGLAAIYRSVGAGARATALFGGFSAAVVGISIGRFWQMGVAAMALAMSLAGGASSGEIALVGVGAGLVLDLGTKRARLARSRRIGHGRGVALPDEGEPLDPDGGRTVRAVAAPAIAAALLTLFAGGTRVSLAPLSLRTGLGA